MQGKINLTKEAESGSNRLIEMLAAEYSKVLDISNEDAKKILTDKFNKHFSRITEKYEDALRQGVLDNIQKDGEYSIDEYLKKKPVIKG
jgi:predicted DNA-binding protein (UPF0278 family)